MNQEQIKCPICHQETIGKIPPRRGDVFALVELEKENAEILESVVMVDMYGCSTCGNILLHSPWLISK
ncbi:MAG: hypothetical protein ACLUPE_07260 [Turicibacter sanguinis]|uniref:hypothetical protein n=1 Tax=Turicibacter sanguinis TaxID=154288 RepID=UPI003992CAC9